MLAAGPLLVASQTSDPFLVSMAVLAGYLPTLIFGVMGGAAADRFDRRRMVIAVNLCRAVALTVLVLTILTSTDQHRRRPRRAVHPRHRRDVRRLREQHVPPGLVAREDLGLANARMQGAFLFTNQLVAPPIGAFLFAIGMAMPFAANAAASCSAPCWCRGSS